MVNYDKIPNDRMERDVKQFVENGVIYGDFLYALLSNDLMETFSRADMENKEKLDEWTIFVYNELPASCWGSPEKVENWDGLNN